MPSNVTNLDDIVGGDHAFIYRETEYLIPGDPQTETVFEFLKLYDDLLEAQQAALTDDPSKEGLAGKREDVERLILTIRAKLLVLFQELNPDMKTLPFGHRSTMIVMTRVLGLLGVTIEQVPDPPAPAPKKAAPRRATSVKTKPRARTAARK